MSGKEKDEEGLPDVSFTTPKRPRGTPQRKASAAKSNTKPASQTASQQVLFKEKFLLRIILPIILT